MRSRPWRTTPTANWLEALLARLDELRTVLAGLPGHVRLNLATSPDRLTEIVRRLTASLSGR